jgi:hypothetical protein
MYCAAIIAARRINAELAKDPSGDAFDNRLMPVM